MQLYVPPAYKRLIWSQSQVLSLTYNIWRFSLSCAPCPTLPLSQTSVPLEPQIFVKLPCRLLPQGLRVPGAFCPQDSSPTFPKLPFPHLLTFTPRSPLLSRLPWTCHLTHPSILTLTFLYLLLGTSHDRNVPRSTSLLFILFIVCLFP